jgi:hypothetical protein
MACSESYDQKLLLGQWKTSSWIDNSSQQSINNKMDFDFQDNRKYSIDYGSMKERGTYYISGGYLHTTETGRAEKKVNLLKVVQDSVVFEMNRGGAIETVILTRK